MFRATIVIGLLVVVSCGDSLPEQSVIRTELKRYADCSSLEQDLKEMLAAELEAESERPDWFFDVPIGTEIAADSAPETASPPPREGEDFSGTNNQVVGVDEADFVKTDGTSMFVIHDKTLHIFGIPTFGQLDSIHAIELEGRPREMLYDQASKRMAVFSEIDVYLLPEEHPVRNAISISDPQTSAFAPRVTRVSKLTVLDLSRQTQPTLIRELFMEGKYETARLVDGNVRMATYAHLIAPIWTIENRWEDRSSDATRKQIKHSIDQMSLADLVPFLYERRQDGRLLQHELSQSGCRSFYRPTDSHARGTTSIFSLNLRRSALVLDADHIVSNSPTIYSSQHSLYIAEPTNDWWWFWRNQGQDNQLNLHKFDTRRSGAAQYVASGRVDGTLLNQFSLDEYDGHLRVATTQDRQNRWWLSDQPPSTNHVYVLKAVDRVLTQVGHVGDIAPNEQIFAARFDEDRGYLVTFEQTDPLFTLDLSDPSNPQVIGELEIFGFSTYIHPVGRDHLLTIGVGGDETGANWRTQISMFDIHNATVPRRVDVEELITQGQWGWSEAQHEHKAFQYWAPQSLLAVPISGTSTPRGIVSTLELIKVSTSEGLSRHGTINHSHFFRDGERWYRPEIRRSIFMGEYVYVVSTGGITVHRTESLAKVDEIALPKKHPDHHHWWW